ncbi:hypothetical protein ARMA_2747 [Ardenticatena maritima]|uniref:Uncharacterized protein n=1 Tax=Ardenticatena maritima TaxID=872965 RepID=A0A0M9UDS1_9CHLR|nr:hypothetical protein ARMA_2747 [Ardenticatena maritima]
MSYLEVELVLLFGARKGVPETVMKWFFAHLEHRLPSSKG